MHLFLLLINFLLLPFNSIDAQPEFKGGANALNYFIGQQLIYPEYSRQNCISGTIQVSFNVDKQGAVYNVKVYKGLGVDLDDEALRVIKLTSGKWQVPANYETDASLILPISFRAEETRCAGFESNDMAAAIDAYKARTGLVDAVTNYYANKYEGKADVSKEPLILDLKEQLGLDENYADRIVAQARRKLKQGDKTGACQDWLFVKNIGSNKADKWLAQYCK